MDFPMYGFPDDAVTGPDDPPAPSSLKLDFSLNPKQSTYMYEALTALSGNSDYRHLYYGGAIRGGKSYVSLAILAIGARQYNNSRWHVFRRDMPALITTTVPSMERVLGRDPDWRWHRDPANYYVECISSGGRVYFKAESLTHDPELNDLLGLETNGILFEQIEELSEKLWQMGISRIGSNYIPQMPRPITLATFNPTQTWIKERVYKPWIHNELEAPHYYMNALPSDNAYVTSDQWELWRGLDENYQRQYIEGDWTDFRGRDGLWAYSFDPDRHIAKEEMEPVPMQPLYLSFDFNRNPMCCSVIQCIDHQIRVLETIKMRDADVYGVCRYILGKYGPYMYMVTGDASGMHRSVVLGNNANAYTIIQTELSIHKGQMRIPTSNPRLIDNQVLINSILSQRDVRINAKRAAGLIYDLNHVRTNADGSIIKANRSDPTQQADALDTFRYYCNVFHPNVLTAS